MSEDEYMHGIRRTLHPDAIAALIRAADRIEASPSEFDMSGWLCATSACVGGQLALEYYNLRSVRAWASILERDITDLNYEGLYHGDERNVALSVLNQMPYAPFGDPGHVETKRRIHALRLWPFDDLFYTISWWNPWKDAYDTAYQKYVDARTKTERFYQLEMAEISANYVRAYARAHADPADPLPDVLKDIDTGGIPTPTDTYHSALQAWKGVPAS